MAKPILGAIEENRARIARDVQETFDNPTAGFEQPPRLGGNLAQLHQQAYEQQLQTAREDYNKRTFDPSPQVEDWQYPPEPTAWDKTKDFGSSIAVSTKQTITSALGGAAGLVQQLTPQPVHDVISNIIGFDTSDDQANMLARGAEGTNRELQAQYELEVNNPDSTLNKFGNAIGSALGFLATMAVPLPGGQAAGAARLATKAKTTGDVLKGALASGKITPEAYKTTANMLAKRGASRKSAIIGAGAGAAVQYAQNLEEYRNAVANGTIEDTPENRMKLTASSIAIGMTEAIPLSNALNRFDQAMGGAIKSTLLNIGKGVFEEGLQEFGQTLANNAVASKLVGWDPERQLFEDTAESAALGGGVGGLLNFLVSLPGLPRTHRLAKAQKELSAQKKLQAQEEATIKYNEDNKLTTRDELVNPFTNDKFVDRDVAEQYRTILNLSKEQDNYRNEDGSLTTVGQDYQDKIDDIKKQLQQKINITANAQFDPTLPHPDDKRPKGKEGYISEGQANNRLNKMSDEDKALYEVVRINGKDGKSRYVVRSKSLQQEIEATKPAEGLESQEARAVLDMFGTAGPQQQQAAPQPSPSTPPTAPVTPSQTTTAATQGQGTTTPSAPPVAPPVAPKTTLPKIWADRLRGVRNLQKAEELETEIDTLLNDSNIDNNTANLLEGVLTKLQAKKEKFEATEAKKAEAKQKRADAIAQAAQRQQTTSEPAATTTTTEGKSVPVTPTPAPTPAPTQPATQPTITEPAAAESAYTTEELEKLKLNELKAISKAYNLPVTRSKAGMIPQLTGRKVVPGVVGVKAEKKTEAPKLPKQGEEITSNQIRQVIETRRQQLDQARAELDEGLQDRIGRIVEETRTEITLATRDGATAEEIAAIEEKGQKRIDGQQAKYDELVAKHEAKVQTEVTDRLTKLDQRVDTKDVASDKPVDQTPTVLNEPDKVVPTTEVKQEEKASKPEKKNVVKEAVEDKIEEDKVAKVAKLQVNKEALEAQLEELEFAGETDSPRYASLESRLAATEREIYALQSGKKTTEKRGIRSKADLEALDDQIEAENEVDDLNFNDEYNESILDPKERITYSSERHIKIIKALSEVINLSHPTMKNKLHIVSTFDRLPEALKNLYIKNERDTNKVKAVTWNGNVYFISDKITPGTELSVYMHEVGVHLGMQRIFSDKEITKISDMIQNWTNNSDTPEGTIAQSVLDMWKNAGLTFNNDIQSKREMIAYFVEHAILSGYRPINDVTKTSNPIIQLLTRIYNAIKRALKLPLKVDMKDNVQMMIDLAYGAARLPANLKVLGVGVNTNIDPSYINIIANRLERQNIRYKNNKQESEILIKKSVYEKPDNPITPDNVLIQRLPSIEVTELDGDSYPPDPNAEQLSLVNSPDLTDGDLMGSIREEESTSGIKVTRNKIKDILIKFANSVNEVNSNLNFHYYNNESIPNIKKPINYSGKYGFYYKTLDGIDHIFFNLDKIKTEQEAKRVFLHEVVGHYGLRSLMGDRWKSFLDRMIKDIPSVAISAAARSNELIGEGIQVNTEFPSLNYKLPNGQTVDRAQMQLLMEEYLAVEAERFLDDPKYMQAALRTDSNLLKRADVFLKHNLKKYVGETTFNFQDIMHLLAESQNKVFGNDEGLAIYNNLDREPLVDYRPENSWSQEVQESHFSDPSEFYVIQNALKTKESQNAFIDWWRNGVNALFTAFNRRFPRATAFGSLIGASPYRRIQSAAAGDKTKIEIFTRRLQKKMSRLTPTQNEAIYNYFTTAGANVNVLPVNADLKQDLVEAKNTLQSFGQRLVDLGLLRPETMQRNEGKYLPTMYLAYLNEYKGSGKRPSMLSYLRQKKDFTILERELKDQIKDPGYLVPNTLLTIGRDLALLEMYNNMAKVNREHQFGWIIDPKQDYLEINGEKISVIKVYEIIENLENTLKIPVKENPLLKSQQAYDLQKQKLEQYQLALQAYDDNVIKELQRAYKADHGTDLSLEDAIRLRSKNYKFIPWKEFNMGALRGKWIRNEIYHDLYDTLVDMNKQNLSTIAKLIGPGSKLEKFHQIWKSTKVGMNPTSWSRNYFGNFYLLDIGTSTPTHQLIKMLWQEMHSTFTLDKKAKGHYGLPSIGITNAEWARIAIENGLYGQTMTANELYHISNMYNDTILREKGYDIGLREHIFSRETKGIGAIFQTYDKFMDFFLRVAERTGYGHSLMEGIFKQVALRDYIQRWEKQNKQQFKNLDPTTKQQLINLAVEHANDMIFNYSEVPDFIRDLRRLPLGSPFITFTYKAIGATAKNSLKHPWKMFKYAGLPYLVLAAAGMDDDEYEEALKRVPKYMRDKSTLFVTPWKDANGKYIYNDMSYMFPHATYPDLIMKLVTSFQEGKPLIGLWNTVHKDLGLMGGPLPQAMAALLTGVDPFTGREIAGDYDSPTTRMEKWASHWYTMMAPPTFTQYGALGRTLNQFGVDLPILSTGEELDSVGKDKETGWQTVSRAFGVTAGGFSPHDEKMKALRTFDYQRKDIKRERSRKLRDRNLPSTERASVIKHYAELLRENQRKRTEYLQKGY